MPTPASLVTIDAGLLDYGDGQALQRRAWEAVASGTVPGVVIACEHQPVITIGRAGGRENLLASAESLRACGVAVVDSTRGGNITCHNPGQIVLYPVLDLHRWGSDAHGYLRRLEGVVIATLARFGLHAGRKPGRTGVWLGDEKVCAIGVGLRRWITSHGLALNVANDLSLFDAIVPCGIREFGVTSLRRSGITASRQQVLDVLLDELAVGFDCHLSAPVRSWPDVVDRRSAATMLSPEAVGYPPHPPSPIEGVTP